ncbi:MAG: tail fiber domain-containing protein [Gammaproteobacteria bacterium]|nr:tail fiber domain-containing protein [Gammaproteobacteria bacterium]NNJ84880.1 tail fiber domain-containing protein [Gammaproteobacteria bacterium]
MVDCDVSKGTDRQVGVIAQELEKEFPELVSTDSEGYKSVAYGKLTAVLIEAIKAQQSRIEAQQAQIEALRNRVER